MSFETRPEPVMLPPMRRVKLGARHEMVLAAGVELWAHESDRALNPKALAVGPCVVIAQAAIDAYDVSRMQLYWRVVSHQPIGEAAEVLYPPEDAWLRAELDRLRADNARLGAALAAVQDELHAVAAPTPAARHAEALLALAQTIARMPHPIGEIAVAALARLGLPRR